LISTYMREIWKFFLFLPTSAFLKKFPKSAISTCVYVFNCVLIVALNFFMENSNIF
jgi:hypothetical protein